MFTRNWYKLLGQYFGYDTDPCKYTGYTGDKWDIYKKPDIAVISLCRNVEATYCPSLHHLRTSALGYGGVILGSGTTPATVDDYCFAGDIISTFSSSSSVVTSYDEDSRTFTSEYSISNAGGADITIGEIGLIANIEQNYSNTSITFKALLERTVLDSPLIIPAGGVGKVTYTIRMVYPTV